MPKSKTSNKIPVSSGTATDIFSDLDVGKQAAERAHHYITVATGSLKLKAYPPTTLVVSKNPSTGETIVREVAKKKVSKLGTTRRKAKKKKA